MCIGVARGDVFSGFGMPAQYLFEGGMKQLRVVSHLLLAGFCWGILETALRLQHCTHSMIVVIITVITLLRIGWGCALTVLCLPSQLVFSIMVRL